MDFSKWQPEILIEIQCESFLGKSIPVRSVFVINISLLTSVVFYCQNG